MSAEISEKPAQLQHWHTIYKLSTVSSPTQEINREISGYDLVTGNNSVNKRLSLLVSNMQAEGETCLRSVLTTKINKLEILDTTSQVVSVDQFIDGKKTVQIYYNIVSSRTMETDHDDALCIFLVCFLMAVPSGLELFQKDLDEYCDSLLPHLEKYMESVDVSGYLKHLDTWYESKICSLERCLQYLPDSLDVLLCASFCYDNISFQPDVPTEVKNDLLRFIKYSSLSMLLGNSKQTFLDAPVQEDILALNNCHSLLVAFDTTSGTCTLSSTVSSTFCKECVSSMHALEYKQPIKMRQLIEYYKLKIIQDMNTFKRISKQAETDYYALFKSYVFLASCGNGYVILRNAKLQRTIDNLPNADQVINALELFVEKMGGFEALDTHDHKRELKTKFMLDNSRF